MSGTQIAYRVPDAAAQCGVSESLLRAAIQRGDIVLRYPSTSPVIPHKDLEEWVDSLPTQSPRAPR